ncbi:uncharacterized protein BDZ99DRAFT_568181 [Mytilinidion resinicola]|uniref:Uncharacterized protein n=1 Tax=Mytilinidion resinicola TaxID=574789 RepID=A0A6A6YVQ0_9PEZI|nr:uncharacterized protein BDZ99DRAFT_568181 [Mytilinidion resinicola]KAF2812881.1 hypothetical protein BDZ99DRAFT_568181 [Mytilinidion resinicola]
MSGAMAIDLVPPREYSTAGRKSPGVGRCWQLLARVGGTSRASDHGQPDANLVGEKIGICQPPTPASCAAVSGARYTTSGWERRSLAGARTTSKKPQRSPARRLPFACPPELIENPHAPPIRNAPAIPEGTHVNLPAINQPSTLAKRTLRGARLRADGAAAKAGERETGESLGAGPTLPTSSSPSAPGRFLSCTSAYLRLSRPECRYYHRYGTAVFERGLGI